MKKYKNVKITVEQPYAYLIAAMMLGNLKRDQDNISVRSYTILTGNLAKLETLLTPDEINFLQNTLTPMLDNLVSNPENKEEAKQVLDITADIFKKITS